MNKPRTPEREPTGSDAPNEIISERVDAQYESDEKREKTSVSVCTTAELEAAKSGETLASYDVEDAPESVVEFTQNMEPLSDDPEERPNQLRQRALATIATYELEKVKNVA